MKILIIEDEPSLSEIMQAFLEKQRFVVETAFTYRQAIEKTADYDYDCILLDIMLPDGSGLALLEELRAQRRDENVIILSARDSIDDKVAGLELGADDYLPKPFRLAELHARIRSVVRRKNNAGEMQVRLGNVVIDPDRFEVFVEGNPLELSRKEYDILHFFMGRPNHLIEKETLAEAVWGDHIDQTDNYDFIYAQVKNLRKKLREAGADIELKAVYGYGYKLIESE